MSAATPLTDGACPVRARLLHPRAAASPKARSPASTAASPAATARGGAGEPRPRRGGARRRSCRARRPHPGARRRGRCTSTEPWAAGARPARPTRMVTDRPASRSASSPPTARRCCSPTRAAGVIGAAHAGWRGAVAGVLEATIAAMAAARRRARSGSSPRSVRASAQASYEVGADLRAAVLARDARRRTLLRATARRGTGSSTCPATAPPACRGAASPRSRGSDADTLRRAGRVSSAIGAARWRAAGRSATRSRWSPCRCRDLRMAHIISRITATLALAVLLTLAGMRRPAAAVPGQPRRDGGTARATAARPAAPCRVPGDALLPDAASAAYADAVAKALQSREVPAVAGPVHAGDWRLVLRRTCADSRWCRISRSTIRRASAREPPTAPAVERRRVAGRRLRHADRRPPPPPAPPSPPCSTSIEARAAAERPDQPAQPPAARADQDRDRRPGRRRHRADPRRCARKLPPFGELLQDSRADADYTVAGVVRQTPVAGGPGAGGNPVDRSPTPRATTSATSCS